MRDPYEVLQVHRKAEPEVIQAAYRALARKYHPDFNVEPARMIEINEAWSVLGNAERRIAFDMEALRTQSRRAIDPKATSTTAGQPANAARSGPNQTGSGSVIDFGRYQGWTIDRLAGHDPDYLEWLARTPIGRRLAVEIHEALAIRAADQAARQPAPQPLKRRRSMGRRWPSARSAAG